MRMTEIFTKTQKTSPKDEESVNAKLLERAGFIQKLMAGVYTFLPLGLRVLNKIENIVREEMDKIGGQEVLMPALHPQDNWVTTGRWNGFDALFKVESRSSGSYALGPTHEEVLYPLLRHHISSYRDLPQYVYQIQTKFRDEPRAKSGLLRGREFRMKDLYSFHIDEKDRDKYYEKVKNAYIKIFKRLGLEALPTRASGGTFSENSLEFQALCEAGEDVIFVCGKCSTAVNQEVASGENPKCKECGGDTLKKKAIEVGNIFPLKDKYAKDFNLSFRDERGETKLISAGCYGLGTSRALGAIVETHYDEKGLVWPVSVAPHNIHLIRLGEAEKVLKASDEIYDILGKTAEVFYDDMSEKSAGEKFADADLIGIPLRIVVSEKTLEKDSVEIKKRDSSKPELIKILNLKELC